MAELYIPTGNPIDELTEEEKEAAKKQETESRNKKAVDNATNSDTTRSDAKKPPVGEPTSDERAKNFKMSRKTQNATFKQKTAEEKKKDQIQALRDNANKQIQKQKDRGKEIEAYKKRQNSRDERIAGLGKKGSIGALGFIGALADGAMTYSDERQKDPNGSKLLDLTKAGAVAGAWLLAEGTMWGITLGGMALSGIKMAWDDAQENYDIKKAAMLHVNKDESGSNKGTLGGNMIDNEYAATSRQRQEQIMRNHKISTESILGSEARQLHR